MNRRIYIILSLILITVIVGACGKTEDKGDDIGGSESALVCGNDWADHPMEEGALQSLQPVIERWLSGGLREGEFFRPELQYRDVPESDFDYRESLSLIPEGEIALESGISGWKGHDWQTYNIRVKITPRASDSKPVYCVVHIYDRSETGIQLRDFELLGE